MYYLKSLLVISYYTKVNMCKVSNDLELDVNRAIMYCKEYLD